MLLLLLLLFLFLFLFSLSLLSTYLLVYFIFCHDCVHLFTTLHLQTALTTTSTKNRRNTQQKHTNKHMHAFHIGLKTGSVVDIDCYFCYHTYKQTQQNSLCWFRLALKRIRKELTSVHIYMGQHKQHNSYKF